MSIFKFDFQNGQPMLSLNDMSSGRQCRSLRPGEVRGNASGCDSGLEVAVNKLVYFPIGKVVVDLGFCHVVNKYSIEIHHSISPFFPARTCEAEDTDLLQQYADSGTVFT